MGCVVDGRLAQASRQPAAPRAAALAGGETVHTEHLLLGLYAKPDGPTRGFFDASNVNRAALDAALTRAVGAAVPGLTVTAAPLQALPELSAHARQALENGASAAARLPSAAGTCS